LSLSSKLSAWRSGSGWVTRLMSMPQFRSTSGRISPAVRVFGPTERRGLSVSGRTCATRAHGSSWRTRDRRSSEWRPPSLYGARMGRPRSHPAAASSAAYSSFPTGGARESAGTSWTLFSLRRSGGTTRGFTSGRTKTTSVRTVSTAAAASRPRAEPRMVRASGRARLDRGLQTHPFPAAPTSRARVRAASPTSIRSTSRAAAHASPDAWR